MENEKITDLKRRINIEKKIEDERKIFDERNIVKQTIVEMYNSEEFQKIFQKYYNRIEFIFKSYVAMIEKTIPDIYSKEKEIMIYKNFFLFNEDYNLFPGILISDQIQLIFLSEAKKRVPIGSFLII